MNEFKPNKVYLSNNIDILQNARNITQSQTNQWLFEFIHFLIQVRYSVINRVHIHRHRSFLQTKNNNILLR